MTRDTLREALSDLPRYASSTRSVYVSPLGSTTIVGSMEPSSDGKWVHIDDVETALADQRAGQTCATCRWFRTSDLEDICTKEPSEFPMHWQETRPDFGCNGHEAQP